MASSLKNILNHPIARFYALFAVMIVFFATPVNVIIDIGFILSLVLIMALYMKRRGFDKTSAEHFHFSYLIRTFWYWSLFFVIGMFIAGIIISMKADMSMADTLMRDINSGVVADPAAIQGVIEEFMRTNHTLLLTTMAVCLAPVHFYALYRLIKGFKMVGVY